ncbi:MAG: ABC transporter permease subunit [Myxococcales bacterium]|nr:ABC transporter permease subunit [Myxococcales bacterium]
MRVFASLAWNGFREARRNRVSVVIAAFTLALVGASAVMADVTVYTMRRVVTDFGLGAMAILLSVMAIFLSSGLLTREIERRTIFLMVSRPVSRGLFLVSRLAGNMLTLGAMLLVMSAVFFLQLIVFGISPSAPQLIAAGVLWFELLVLTSFGFLMSSFSGQVTSSVVTVGMFFAGHLANDMYELSARSKSEVVRAAGKAVYYLLPNLERLNYRGAAAYEVTPPLGEVFQSALYSVGYSTVLVALAILLFNRRDFR